MLTMEELMPRVLKGAAWLDTKRPNWFNEIDLDILDLASCERCVLGQCFGRFGQGVRVMFPEVAFISDPVAVRWSQSHGFERDYGGGHGQYATLRECWVTVILERRFQQQSQMTERASEESAGDPQVASVAVSVFSRV